MALQVSGAGLGLFNHRSGLRIRAVASESVTTLRGEEEKVKFGGSDVKVTKLGIGAWSWGDTRYWNDSQWDDSSKNGRKKDPVEVAVATKFAALPWRFGRGSVLSALKDSVSRLGLSSVDLYRLHWPWIMGK